MDAKTLARLARVDPELLRPVRHRNEEAQKHVTVIRVRAALVDGRTAQQFARAGQSDGGAVAEMRSDAMGVGQGQLLSAPVRQLLQPLLEEVESLTKKIKQLDEELAQITRSEYPETERHCHIEWLWADGMLNGCATTRTVGIVSRERSSRMRFGSIFGSG